MSLQGQVIGQTERRRLIPNGILAPACRARNPCERPFGPPSAPLSPALQADAPETSLALPTAPEHFWVNFKIAAHPERHGHAAQDGLQLKSECSVIKTPG